jgi:hypothetical protein
MMILLFFAWVAFVLIGLAMFAGLVFWVIWALFPKTGKTSAVRRD